MTENDCSVLCLGELVWDLFPDRPRMGGAPFNVAVHLARQGMRVSLLTAVGRDELGQRALRFLEKENIPGALVHPRLPTGTVKVELDHERIPHFTIHNHCAWTDLEGAFLAGIPPLDRSLDLARLAVIVFGGLAMHSPLNRLLFDGFLREFQARELPCPVRLCDLNLRPGWSDPEVARWCAERADLLKVNEEEHRFLLGLESDPGRTPDRTLLHRYALQGLCTTLGPEGLRWADPLGEGVALPAWSEDGASPVIDTVGAGDAITAAIAMGVARKEPSSAFLEKGRRRAAAICRTAGALPPPSPALDRAGNP